MRKIIIFKIYKIIFKLCVQEKIFILYTQCVYKKIKIKICIYIILEL